MEEQMRGLGASHGTNGNYNLLAFECVCWIKKGRALVCMYARHVQE
jgi:hypothetical protein